MASEAPNTLLSTATYDILDLLGDGPQSRFILKSGVYGADPLCSTWFDDVVVRNLDGSYNYNVSGQGFQFDYLLGTSTQTGITGFQKVENVIPLSSNTRVANPPVGGGPWKPVIASFNSNTYPDADSVKLTVRVPALYAQDDNGNTNPFSLFFETDISVNNGPWVPQIPIGHTDGDGNPSTVVEIVGKCTSAYQQTFMFVLPKPTPATSFYEWKIRVRRTDVNILKATTANELFVDSIAVVSSNLFAYPNSVLVGLSISADQFATVPARAYEMEGIMVPVPSGYIPTQYPVTGGVVPAVYPDIWYGSFTGGAWTDNPAWIYYDLLTNPVHGLGDYIPSGSVDKWSLYQISQFCDQMVDDGQGGFEPNFTCNTVIQQPDQAYSVLLNLASTFRGMLYYANGTIHATQTDNKEPVFAFTNANVIGGQFSYADTAQNTRSTVAIVKWIDPQNGYRENVAYIEDPDGILRYGYQEKQITAFACTSPGQAYRLGSWALQTERLLTETISFQTDLEGLSVKPGDAFGVYDNFRNNRSQGGRILGFDATRSLITLDRPVTIDPAYIYSLSAIVPKFTLDTVQLTGSDQIPYLEQSQVETFRVITPPSEPTNQLLVSGMFSDGLFIGSPWVLDASGNTASVFQNASFYTCLSTSEVEPGKIEVLGLQANTGIQFTIQTGYTTATYPTNAGDSSPIAPPSNLTIASVTGQTTDNVFYSALRATWVDTPSVNLSYYILSGKAFDESYQGFTVTNTGFDWERGGTGQYLFRLAAVSLGGVQSTFITGGIKITNANPLGSLRGLSGIQIAADWDPLYTTSSGYTGFIGRQPTFQWDVTADNNGVPIVDYDFISGYRVQVKSPDGLTTYSNTPIDISGVENNSWSPADSAYFSTGLSQGAVRSFGLFVDTIDIYGNVVHGASRSFGNPPMKAPFSSGFVGYNGGLNYNVTPSVQYDTSGIYLWVNTNPSFTPTYDNYGYSSSNLAGLANIAPNSGSFYTWFALGDTFSRSGNPIFGPISGNANAFGFSAFVDISAEIDAAFGLLTGIITDYVNILSGQNQLTVQSVFGLSGQITGNGTIPGIINTALNVRVDTIVVSSSGSLSTQINAVKASTQTLSGNMTATGAQLIGAYTTADAGLAQWITQLGVQTSGTFSNVQVAARAFVTGDGVTYPYTAVASWGFRLDANGKVVSMVANSTDAYGYPTQGTIVFGGADLQNDTYTVPGGNGWRITAAGSAEFANASVRGAFTGGAGSSQTRIDPYGVSIGTAGGDRAQFDAGLARHSLSFYNSSNKTTALIGTQAAGGGTDAGVINLFTSAEVNTISLGGNDGSINCDILDVDTTSNFDGAVTMNSNLLMDGVGATFDVTNGTVNGRWGVNNSTNRLTWGTTTNHSIEVYTNNLLRWNFGSDSNLKTNGGDIRKLSSDSWTPALFDGSSTIEFQASAGQIFGRINGGTAILLG